MSSRKKRQGSSIRRLSDYVPPAFREESRSFKGKLAFPLEQSADDILMFLGLHQSDQCEGLPDGIADCVEGVPLKCLSGGINVPLTHECSMRTSDGGVEIVTCFCGTMKLKLLDCSDNPRDPDEMVFGSGELHGNSNWSW
ncbi:MAG: hypothetical protein WCW14_02810 [Candidatus Paceibacterota bacterium]|jgi:hypothetical protein